MNTQVWVIIGAVLLSTTVLSFAEEKTMPDQKIPRSEQAKEKAKFKHSGEVFNNKAHKKSRAKKLARKKAAEEKKKLQESEDKGEGQVKVKF